MPRQLLIHGEKTFKITIPDDAAVTFGPFSPPPKSGQRWEGGEKAGTLRVYKGKSKTDVLAVFSGVRSFRDLTLGYAEEVAREEGAVIWKDDETGYSREDKVQRKREWVVQGQLESEGAKRRRGR
jgi:hypothetical protein